MAEIINRVDLWLPANLWEQMRSDIVSKAPEEACGLIAGDHRRAEIIYPITNVLHSPVRYCLDPDEQVNAFLDIERRGLELQAIYHSHPTGPGEPSPTDVTESFYPETIYLIWFPSNEHWTCRGFYIIGSTISNANLMLSEEQLSGL